MRPNIILITTDQQRTDSLGCYGSPWMRTPHLDGLAAAGVQFDRAYCTNPVCTPSRVSLFSGLPPGRHGVFNVGVNTPDDIVMVSHLLQSADYRTHYIGKAHFQAFMDAPERSVENVFHWQKVYPGFTGPYYGFSTAELAPGHATFGLTGHYGAWVRDQVTAHEFASFAGADRLGDNIFGGEAYDWSLPLRLHNSVWTADRAVDFISRQHAGQPYLLAIGFQDPHHPHCLPRDFKDRVDPATVPLPAFTPGELDDKPPHFKAAHQGRLNEVAVRGAFEMAGQGKGYNYSEVTAEDARAGRAHYYGMVQLIDQQVGRILHALDESGQRDNTLIIFTTDHGELLGDHGLWMKGPFHYEALIRVPLLMRWPANLPAGVRFRDVVSHLDVAPTILRAAQMDAQLPGIDLQPALRAGVSTARKAAMVECTDDPRGLRLKTVVTADRKLTWYSGCDDGELYDLEADSGEIRNLWSDPAYAADKAQLLAALLTESQAAERRLPRYAYA